MRTFSLFSLLLLNSCSSSFALGYSPSELLTFKISIGEKVSKESSSNNAYLITSKDELSKFTSEELIFNVDSIGTQYLNEEFFETNDLIVFLVSFSGDALFLSEVKDSSNVILHSYQRETIETIFNVRAFSMAAAKSEIQKDFVCSFENKIVSIAKYNWIESLGGNVVYRGG